MIGDCAIDQSQDFQGSNEMSVATSNLDIKKLTSKKRQYLQDQINDKNGVYSYLDNPVEYKKARKRLQNRESAVRSRMRKKTYQEELEGQIREQQELINELRRDKQHFEDQNYALLQENQELKQQVAYYSDMFASKSLVGGSNE